MFLKLSKLKTYTLMTGQKHWKDFIQKCVAVRYSWGSTMQRMTEVSSLWRVSVFSQYLLSSILWYDFITNTWMNWSFLNVYFKTLWHLSVLSSIPLVSFFLFNFHLSKWKLISLLASTSEDVLIYWPTHQNSFLAGNFISLKYGRKPGRK